MKDEIKFNLNKDIIMQIEMASYMEYNSRIASINEHLGEIYGYSDLKDAEEAQLHYEKELAYKAIQKLQEQNKRLRKDYGRLLQDNAYTLELEKRNEKAISIIKDIFKDEDWYENYEYNDLEYTLKEICQTLQGDDVSENKSNK